MLVIANGCGWSGSTWLASIVVDIVQPKPLPVEFATDGMSGMPQLKRGMLQRFLAEVDFAAETYVTKSNFYYERDLLEQYDHVSIVDIRRNAADVLISMLHHSAPERMATATPEEVRQAYWHVGPPVVEHWARHHAVWRHPCSWVYRVTYERMKAAPAVEIEAIANFLGRPLSQARLQAIMQATTVSRLAERYGEIKQRFRKGLVGAHKQYFDDAILRDIDRIEAENAEYPATAAEMREFADEREMYLDRPGPHPYERRMAEGTRAFQAAHAL